MKILVADDETDSCLHLSSTLTKWGKDVDTVGDGKKAWEYIQVWQGPLIVFFDWEMSGMSGADLCTRARSLCRKNPLYLILLTSRQKTEDIVSGLSAGADDYISTPCNDDELRARITIAEVLVNAQLLVNKKNDEPTQAENQASRENG